MKEYRSHLLELTMGSICSKLTIRGGTTVLLQRGLRRATSHCSKATATMGSAFHAAMLWRKMNVVRNLTTYVDLSLR